MSILTKAWGISGWKKNYFEFLGTTYRQDWKIVLCRYFSLL